MAMGGATATHPSSTLVIAGRILLAVMLLLGVLLAAADGVQTILFYVPYAAVGAVLVVRRPNNSIGWLLLVLAALDVLSSVSVPASGGPLVAGTAPLVERMPVWLVAVSGGPIFSAYLVLALVFPSGQLPGGRWGRVARLLITLNAILIVGSAIGPTVSVNLADGSTINAANPLALLPPLSWWPAFGNAVFLVLIATDAVAVASMLVRLRGATGLERLQLRWVAASVTLVCGLVAVAIFSGQWFPAVLAFPTVPLAIGIAVLRYRLYEIDRLVSRTVAYGLVTLTLLAVFVGAVLALQALLAPFTSSNELAVAGSTLLIAALFQPLRARVKRLVDRRFNRIHYDAERTLAAFSARLRDEVDLEAIRADITATVAGTVEPGSVALWLR